MGKEKSKVKKTWLANAVFAAVILCLAGGLLLARYLKEAKKSEEDAVPSVYARLTYGKNGEEEAILRLDKDAVYDFQSNGYTIHIKIEDGTAAFVDSPCPDHVCEGFGQLSKDLDWAACMPAQALLMIEEPGAASGSSTGR